ncbi:MAG TPA: hypothetical protein PLF71_02965 [bacterium]|nr:hypothetical protein [bacterium]
MKMFNFQKVEKLKKIHDQEKRALDQTANDLRKTAKVAIFALHRGDGRKAEADLAQAEKYLTKCQSLIKKNSSLANESAYHSALEEYAEAVFFRGYLVGEVYLPNEIAKDEEAVIGGLADLAGEVARYSVLRATEHDAQSVETAHKAVLKIVDWLATLDLTGSLRSKFDQSKQHLRKIEDIRYDLSR